MLQSSMVAILQSLTRLHFKDAAYDQGRHRLLTGISIKNKMKKYARRSYIWK